MRSSPVNSVRDLREKLTMKSLQVQVTMLDIGRRRARDISRKTRGKRGGRERRLAKRRVDDSLVPGPGMGMVTQRGGKKNPPREIFRAVYHTLIKCPTSHEMVL